LLNVAGNDQLRIGVLALQGDVQEHTTLLQELGCAVVEVRLPAHLAELDGLVIPGGESSVMDKLSRMFGLSEPIRQAIRAGLPVLGTCAGLIMLAKRVDGAITGQETFGGMDVTVQRNAFGSQVDSFESVVPITGISGPGIAAAFIRAPIVTEYGDGVDVIASLPEGTIVGVRQGNLIGISFHPELTGDDRVHRLFLATVREGSYRTPATITV